jgi:hypothetical protein
MAQSTAIQLAIAAPVIRPAGDPPSAPARLHKGKSAKVKAKPIKQ